MAETRFIKTVVFGGYDKADVDKKLDFFYNQYYDMKNELRETKLMLAKLREGSDEAAAHDSVLANERAKLTEFQVKNEAMSEKLKSTDDDNKAKEKEIAQLKAKLEEMEEALKDASSKIAMSSNGGDANMLGVVFAEAQKSANMILSQAKQQADTMEADSNKLAENMVKDANNKAAKIIYDAEVRAAEITAQAENNAADMEVASGNMKATMLDEVTRIGAEVEKLKALFDEFENSGLKMVEDSKKIIDDTTAELKAGGVPVFRESDRVEAKKPEPPVYEEIDNTYETGMDEETKKKNEDLEKLKAMAASISGASEAKAEEKAEEKPAEKKGNADLSELLAKAKAIK